MNINLKLLFSGLFLVTFSNLPCYAARTGSTAELASASISQCTLQGSTLSTTTTASTTTCYERRTFGPGVRLFGINNNGDAVGNTGLSQFPDPNPGRAILVRSGTQDIIDLGVAGSAWAVNDTGTVVGSIHTSTVDGYVQARNVFVYQNGSIQEITSNLSNAAFYPTSINNRGDIVGSFYQSSGSPETSCIQPIFIRKNENGGYDSLEFEPEQCASNSTSDSSIIYWDINNRGRIVAGSFNFAYLIDLNQLMPRAAFPGLEVSITQSFVYGINELNDIAGSVVINSDRRHPIAVIGGQIQDITLPEGINNGYADDINDSGEVVGTLLSDIQQAFIYKNGVLSHLDDLLCNPLSDGSYLASANKINNRGEILAQRQDASYNFTQEILTPRVITSSGGSPSTGGSGTCYPQ